MGCPSGHFETRQRDLTQHGSSSKVAPLDCRPAGSSVSCQALAATPLVGLDIGSGSVVQVRETPGTALAEPSVTLSPRRRHASHDGSAQNSGPNFQDVFPAPPEIRRVSITRCAAC